jgi:hypothetical protein
MVISLMENELKKKICEINGVRYMSTTCAAELWEMSQRAVASACKEGLIPNANKDTSGKWIIPVDARKPLSKKEVRLVLIGILNLKNRKEHIEVVSPETRKVCDYLVGVNMIEDNYRDSNFPEAVVLTDKGMRLAIEGNKISDTNWVTDVCQFIQVITNIIEIWKNVSTLR